MDFQIDRSTTRVVMGFWDGEDSSNVYTSFNCHIPVIFCNGLLITGVVRIGFAVLVRRLFGVLGAFSAFAYTSVSYWSWMTDDGDISYAIQIKLILEFQMTLGY